MRMQVETYGNGRRTHIDPKYRVRFSVRTAQNNHLTEAKSKFKEVYQKRVPCLGEWHPDTLTALRELIITHYDDWEEDIKGFVLDNCEQQRKRSHRCPTRLRKVATGRALRKKNP